MVWWLNSDFFLSFLFFNTFLCSLLFEQIHWGSFQTAVLFWWQSVSKDLFFLIKCSRPGTAGCFSRLCTQCKGFPHLKTTQLVLWARSANLLSHPQTEEILSSVVCPVEFTEIKQDWFWFPSKKHNIKSAEIWLYWSKIYFMCITTYSYSYIILICIRFYGLIFVFL